MIAGRPDLLLNPARPGAGLEQAWSQILAECPGAGLSPALLRVLVLAALVLISVDCAAERALELFIHIWSFSHGGAAL